MTSAAKQSKRNGSICVVLVLNLSALGVTGNARGNSPAEPPNAVATPATVNGEALKLVEAWSVTGSWDDVACDTASGDIYALDSSGSLARFDLEGKPLSRVQLQFPKDEPCNPLPVWKLCLANLTGDTRPEFVVRSKSNKAVCAFDATGALLWSYPTDDSPFDVRPATALRDPRSGYDPIVLGCNARGGVQLINHDGTRRWRNTNIANVWSVCVAKAGDKGEPEIVTTAADGRIHFFDTSGSAIRVVAAPAYSSMLLVATAGTTFKPLILTNGDDDRPVFALESSGVARWKFTRPAGTSGGATQGAVAEGRPWCAVSFTHGMAIYDVSTGALLASAKHSHDCPVAWTPAAKDKPPLLLVAGEKLRAFDLQNQTTSGPATKQP